jgi:uncharacterized membrane protein
MASIQESCDVQVPIRTAYNQWTQFEEFPRFMEGVKSVRQIDDTHMHWVVEVGGKEYEWMAGITEQHPDQMVAWKATDGHGISGVVTFQPLGEGETRITVQMDHETDGLMEQVGSALGVDSRRVKADLERFKDLVESRGVEAGAWRGEVAHGERVR